MRPPPDDGLEGMPGEEKTLIGMLIVLGGVRVLAAILAREPLDSEGMIALLGLVSGMWWGLSATRLRARWRRRRPGILHDGRP